MVVGDDQIDAELIRALCRFSTPDAAIDRHDHPHVEARQPLDGRRLQPIPVAQPLGNVVHHVGAQQLQRAPEHDGGRDTVDVVVAVHGNSLASRNRPEQTIDADVQVDEQIRIVQMLQGGIEKAGGVPPPRSHRGGRGDARRGG